MMKFSEWLEANPTMSTTLMRELRIKRASVSNAKNGKITIPSRWIPVLVRLSKRKLSYESLVHEQLERKRANRALRGAP